VSPNSTPRCLVIETRRWGAQLEDGIDVKQLAVDELRPVFEPRLQRHKLTWEQVETVVKTIADPRDAGGSGSIAADARGVSRPVRKEASPGEAASSTRTEDDQALKHSLEWADAASAIESMADVDRLQQAIEDPNAFVKEL
jgi:hypothetical protein